MSGSIPADKLEALQAALFAGRKIDAIKEYRALTGLGLAESKAAVEKLEAELRAQSPEKFTAPPGGRGCLGLIVVGVVLAATAAWAIVSGV